MQTKKLSRHAKWWTLSALVTTLILGSCQKQELQTQNENSPQIENLSSRVGNEVSFVAGTNTLLGQSKLNPYSIKNMALAWQNLANKGIIFNGETSVYTTHLYVKFKPQNSDQYEQLHEDSTLAFSDYPIESNVIQNGDFYHDPSLPDSVPTYQYTAVKADYQFPEGIPYEILDKLYIPETDNVFQYENGGTSDLFVDQLLNQAYSQTGNYEDTIALDNPTINSARRYTPGGRIRVFDTRLQQWIGMEGVRVQARRWFIFYNARPDFNGNYRMSQSFKRPCNYSIWFAHDRFSVRHNVVNTTFWVNGPKITGDWNYDLNNEYQRFAGHVFRGGYRYHNKDIGGLQRPFRWLRRRTIYVAVDGIGDESGINWIVLPIIKVWRYQNEKTEYMSDEIFSTTSHETGHTSHVIRMNAGPIQFWQVSRQLQESWAIGIEWFLTNIEYNDRGINNYGKENYFPATPPQFPNSYAFQYWQNTKSSNWYTPLYIDIIDNINQNGINYLERGTGTVDDQLSGYTLPNIEAKMLKHIYGLSSLAQELKDNKPAGATDGQIDLLISHF